MSVMGVARLPGYGLAGRSRPPTLMHARNTRGSACLVKVPRRVAALSGSASPFTVTFAPQRNAWGRRRGAFRGAVLRVLATANTTRTAMKDPSLGAEGVPRGETAGACVLLQDGRVSAGDRDLLIEACARIEPGNCVGLVGTNGCGKSTLLRCLMGKREVDKGNLLVSPSVPVGYLEQTAVSGSDLTVWEEAQSNMASTYVAQSVAKCEQAIKDAEGDEAAIMEATKKLQNAQARLDAVGGGDADARTARVLNGLGFTPDDWHTKCELLSGGLLLLDEPTNHLDGAAVSWLAGYLANLGQQGVGKSATTTVLVSHDAELLEVACSRILEIRGGRLHSYSGGWEYFLREREERERRLLAEMEAREEEMAKLRGFIERFGAKATKASQAQSRQKQLDKLMAEQAAMVIPTGVGEGPGDTKRKQSLRLPRAPRGARELIKLQDAEIGWPDGDCLMSDVTVTVERGQRIVVLGPNGAGKSTLLRALAGNAAVRRAGTWAEGEGLQLGVFEQDQAQFLPKDKLPVAHVTDAVIEDGRQKAPTKQECLRALGALGLSGSAIDRVIGEYSGGEKTRVSLAVMALKESNVLLLDEVSNHLDVGTIDTLTEALRRYDGAIVAITHNRRFAQRLEPTHILHVRDGAVRMAPCLGDEDLGDEAFLANKADGAGAPADLREETEAATPQSTQMSYEDRKKVKQVKSRLEKVIKLVEQKEGKCEALDQEMLEAGADIGKATELQAKKTKLEEEIEELMGEWEELEELVGNIEVDV